MWRTAVALIVAAVLAGAALVVRSVVSPDLARAAIERRLSTWIGAPVGLAGRAEVRLLPLPNVRFVDVAVTRRGEPTPVAEAGAVVARLGFAGLLAGRVEVVAIAAEHPTLRLDAAPLERLPALLSARFAEAPVGRLEIDDGRLIVALPGGGFETIAVDEARIGRNGPSSGTTVDAALHWRDRAVSLVLRRPTAAADASPTGAATLRITAPGLDLDFAGATDGRGTTGGNLSVSLADPGDLLRWIGSPVEPSLFDGQIGLSGRLEVVGAGATLAGARLDLAGDRGEGALSLRFDGPRPRLAATLAFDTIDHRAVGPRTFGPGLETLPLDRILPPIDLDLRLSATKIVADAVTLDRVAASFAVTERKILLEIGNVDLWSTAATAVLRGEVGERGLEAQVKASIADLPVDRALETLRIAGVESGRAGLTLDADLRCRRLAGCLADVAGRAKIEAKGLKVTGASPFGDTGRFRPIVVRTASAISTSLWDRLDADLRFVGRRAEIDRLEIDARGPRFGLTGSGDFVTGALDLVGTAQFPAPRQDPARPGGVDAVTIPIRVGGTVRGPEITQRTPDVAPTGGTTPAPVTPRP